MKKITTIGLCFLIFVAWQMPMLSAQPMNDNVCNALEVVLGGSSIVVDNANATVEANENSIVPPSSTDCVAGTWCDQTGPGGGAGIDNSVWFKFTAPTSTAVSIDICNSSFDTQLALYEATDCSDFSTFTYIWATDDQAGCGAFTDEFGDAQSDLSSSIRIECLEAGKEYFILVDAWQNAARNADTLGEIIMIVTAEDKLDPGVALTNTPTIISPECPGGENGSIDISLINGVEPVSYNWDNGEKTQDLTGLAAGTYSVTITDFCNTSVTASFEVEEPSSLPDVVIADSNVEIVHPTHCGDYAHGGQLTATVSSGVAPYAYAWSNGETDPHIDSLADGTYTLTVTDACGEKTSEKTYTLGAHAGPDQMCNNNSQVLIGVDNSASSGSADVLSYTDLVVEDLNVLFRCATSASFMAPTTYWQAYDLQVDFEIEEEVVVTGMEVFFFARNGAPVNGMANLEFRLYISPSTDLSDTSDLILVDEVITQMPRLDFDGPSYIVPFKPSKFGPGDIVVIEAAYVGQVSDEVEIYHLGMREQVTTQPSYVSSACTGLETPVAMNTGPLAGLNLNFANNLILAGEGQKLSYAWDNSSGGLSADDIATPLATNGSYPVTITDLDCGQTFTDTVNVTGCWTVGTEELAEASFSISPNPSNGIFVLQNEGEQRDLRLELFDLQGRLVHRDQFGLASGASQSLDISRFAKGIYLAKLTDKNRSESHRLIIQ